MSPPKVIEAPAAPSSPSAVQKPTEAEGTLGSAQTAAMKASKASTVATAAQRPPTLGEMVTEAEAALASAQTAAAKASSDVEQLAGQLVEARERYFADPDDGSARDRAISLAASLDLAQHRARAAAAKVEAAESSLAAARSTLASSDLEAKKTTLRKAASPETLHAATAPLWDAFFASSSLASLEGIERALAASVAASTELGKLGEHTPPLSEWHAFLPFLESEVAAGRSFRMGLEREPAPPTAMGFLMIRANSIPMPPEHTAGLLDRVRVLRAGARRMTDVERIIGDEGSDRQRALMADYRLPERRSANGRVDTIGK